ncbi:MAG: DUF4293 domain-containing protein [Bacteroidales bacterium]|nr:DUF4293 domain-containing protein [Bacteroidales bacterium]
MWQRVQTLYFAVAAGLMAALLCTDFARVPGSEEAMRYAEYLPYAVLSGLALACTLVALFAWSRRSLQIRLGGAAAVVLLALQVWLAVGYFKLPQEYVVRWTAVFPLIALIFDILALRGVYADELLVRSSSRLRSAKRKQNK